MDRDPAPQEMVLGPWPSERRAGRVPPPQPPEPARTARRNIVGSEPYGIVPRPRPRSTRRPRPGPSHAIQRKTGLHAQVSGRGAEDRSSRSSRDRRCVAPTISAALSRNSPLPERREEKSTAFTFEEGIAGARGRKRLETETGQKPGRTRVPRIRYDESLGALVQSLETPELFPLGPTLPREAALRPLPTAARAAARSPRG